VGQKKTTLYSLFLKRLYNYLYTIQGVFRLTFRLLMTLPAPHKAMRSIAGVGNVGEGGVGME
jgi:hypothetical protein